MVLRQHGMTEVKTAQNNDQLLEGVRSRGAWELHLRSLVQVWSSHSRYTQDTEVGEIKTEGLLNIE